MSGRNDDITQIEPASTDRPPVLAISMGDPTGIGPEVTVKAIAMARERAELGRDFRARVFGDGPMLGLLADELGFADLFDDGNLDAGGFNRAGVSLVHGAAPVRDAADGALARAGLSSSLYVQRAIESVKLGIASGGAGIGRGGVDVADRVSDAIVTAPISKEAWNAAGVDFPGHTELLADRFDSPKSGMLFVGPSLRVILASIHIPLRDVAEKLTSWKVQTAIELGERACREMGIARPRVAVAGINPHAGENGLFGDEDERIVKPAVERAREAGMDVRGPVPGDAVFLQALKGEHDLVVAMYHDQGLIPVKIVDRERTVNVTVGLNWEGKRVIRTSPAHGTANDIAGKNIADATSMLEAMRLAAKLWRSAET
ncbi:MAG: 4-hydroxythreonine-4-phosphate dehydrogenase PdxA [Phycisphaerales bacterium]|nr:4-hydroxythreonine-4-phosphate dehydrogenase PdxA [Phycisphaerales bacterium]